ncbi:6-hydroxy-D-nicotine oxidase [Hypoxylon sp. NC0597]|nr:6-hydroxy-D-nicotine oxidase [Hypoxylon sp. NC0597]
MSNCAAAACALLTSKLQGRVTSPSDAQYQSEQEFPWSQTCWLPAACYVRPRTAEEVAITLEAIRETGSQFVIRSGGHNCNPNISSIDSSGVVVDLRDLNSISIDKSSGMAHIGPGCTWGQVYTFLEDYGRTTTGGRQKDVGAGGFILGGGLSAFSNLHGLAVDNVINFEVVLANSTIVNANITEKPDLYRALKGGGANFGIVTRFDIETHENKAHFTLNIYDPADYPNILRATVDVQEAMETDPKLDMFVNFNRTMVVVGLFYAEWISEPPKAFQPFYNLKSLISSVVTATNGTMKSLVDSLGPTNHIRRQVYTSSSWVSYDLYLEAHKHWLKALEKHPEGGNLYFAIQPKSTNFAKFSEVRGGNTLGIEHVPQSWWAFVVEWTEQENDAAANECVSKLCSKMRKTARDQGQLLDLIFMNDASSSQNVLRSYGAENARRLREAAAKYDPERIFQKLQKDGFLIRKM